MSVVYKSPGFDSASKSKLDDVSTNVSSLSASSNEWNLTHTTVQSNSADWGTSSSLDNYSRGFDRRVDTDSMGDVVYGNATTRTFSISAKPGRDNFKFKVKGVWVYKTGVETLACPDTTGTYYWFFDTDGVLTVALDGTIGGLGFVMSAICGLAYYNKEAGTFEGAIDEQHGCIMDAETHLNLHLTHGFKWSNGGDITGLVDGASTYTGISVGAHFDEDIPNVSPPSTTHSFMYRIGPGEDTAGWEFSTPDNNIGFNDGGLNVVFNEYDNGGSGEWELIQSGGSTDYIIYFFLKTNLATHRYVKIVGQTTYSSRSSARNGLKNDLKAVKLSGLPSAEAEFQFAYICKRNGTLEDDGIGNAYVDLRGVSINSVD